MANVTNQLGSGIESLGKRITELVDKANLSKPAFRQAVQPLLQELEAINKHERLAGLDRYGKPLTPVKYRPKGQVDQRRSNSPARPKFSARAAFGNLTSTEYRRLDGPPLAPRRAGSRVISNYVVGMEFTRGQWRVRAGWRDVLNTKGKPFLQHHFNGTSVLPVRDIGALSRRAVGRLQAIALDLIRPEV